MKRLIISHCILYIIFVAAGCISAFAQQPTPTEKQDLVMKFRQLTGADRVNLGINVSFEDIKNDLTGTVNSDTELTEAQKQELSKFAIEAYGRLDKQLKDFLDNKSTITPISEAAVFQVYDQAFTETELKELITFYSTTTGQKALQFLPSLSAQVQTSFQSMLVPKLQEFIAPKIIAESEQLKQRIQEAKARRP